MEIICGMEEVYENKLYCNDSNRIHRIGNVFISVVITEVQLHGQSACVDYDLHSRLSSWLKYGQLQTCVLLYVMECRYNVTADVSKSLYLNSQVGASRKKSSQCQMGKNIALPQKRAKRKHRVGPYVLTLFLFTA